MASPSLPTDKLVLFLRELGPSCTSDEDSFRGVVRQCPHVTEQTVAEILGLLAKSPAPTSSDAQKQISGGATAENLSRWNIPVIVDVLKQAKSDLDWGIVAEQLDHDDFGVLDPQGFALMIAAYKRGSGGEQPPFQSIAGRPWRNVQGQLSLLLYATAAPPDVYTFEGVQRKKLPPVQGLLDGRSPYGTPNQAWLCRDLLEVLCCHTETGHFSSVRQILELPAKTCPEVLLLGFASVPAEWGLLPREVFGALFPMFLDNSNPNSSTVMRTLWSINQGLVIEILVEYYSQDAAHISRVLALSQELQGLDAVLGSTPYPFSLELACAASRRELLSLDKWLMDHMARDAAAFLPALLRFLDSKTQMHLDGVTPVHKVTLSKEAVCSILRVLHQSLVAGAVPSEVMQDLQRVQKQAATLLPAATQGSEKFASDVEAEANTYFQAIYSGQRSVEDVIAMLHRFRHSELPREQEVFARMVHNLLNEFKFFSRYPDKELHLTAQLFGSLVQQQLVSSITLGIALRHVLDALRKPAGSNMFTFGLDALRQFGTSLGQLQAFCTQLVQIPSLKEADIELFQHAQGVIIEVAGGGGGVGGGSGVSGPPGDLQVNVKLDSIPFLGTPVSPHSGNAEPRQLFAAPLEVAAAGATTVPKDGLAGMTAANAAAAAGAAKAAASVAALTLGQQLQQLSGVGAPGALPPLGPSAAAGVAAVAGPPRGTVPLGPSHRIDTSVDLEDKEDNDLAAAMAAQVASSSLQPANARDAPSLAAQVNTESLESAAEKFKDFIVPPPSAMDRIHFLINNMTLANVDTKVGDLKAKVFPDYLAWFANYLVVKRAAQEANYHTLYVALCDKMADKELYSLLIKTTLYYVKILLYSERTVKESNDRALLKNLGVWLGLLTFAKNKPVLSRELELKKVLIDAYQRGRLIAVLPFMQKLLECCKDSKVFRPTNPMIAGVLSHLAELHSLKGLKINNVFCIELVFKAFSIMADDVKPTDVLRKLTRERQCNQDWGMENLVGEAENTTPLPDSKTAVTLSSQQQQLQQQQQGSITGQSTASMQGSPMAGRGGLQSVLGGSAGAQQQMQQKQQQDGKSGSGMMMGSTDGGTPGGPSAGGGSAASSPGVDPALLANLHQLITINPQLAAYVAPLQLKRVVPPAVERAVLEILTPVVERSVTIACYTTVELLVKDFAMDPDEGRMRKAAHLMVSTLAGSLALVTCKEPLRAQLNVSIKAQLQAQAANIGADVLENLVGFLVQDNLDLGCSFIERAAMDKAIRDVDKLLQMPYEERHKARAQGKPFSDTSSFHGRFPQSLPESLRPRPGQVNAQMLRVYEDFARIPRSVAAVPGGNSGVGVGGGRFTDGDAKHGSADPAAYLERYMQWQARSDAAIQSKDAEGPGADQTHLQQLLQEVSLSVSEAGAPADDVAVFLSRRLLKHLNDGGSKLHTTFYVACLEALVLGPGGKKLPEELARLVVDEVSRVSKEVVEVLARGRLLLLPELDKEVAKVLVGGGKGMQGASELLMHLIKTCMLRMDSPLSYLDMPKSLDMLAQLASRNSGNETILQALDMARKASMLASVAVRPASEIPNIVRDKADPEGLRDRVIVLFEEWLRLLPTGPDEKNLSSYLLGLRTAGMLELDDTTDRFLRLLIELSINHALVNMEPMQQQIAAGREPAALVAGPIDSLIRLVSVIVGHGGGESFLTRFLGVLVGVIKRDADERGTAFNSRPFLRVLAGLVAELKSADAGDTSSNRYVKAIGLAMYKLQPISVPSFAFAWLELVAHRTFMPWMLASPQGLGSAIYQALLSSLLKFLEPYLRTADLSESIRILYKGTLRLLLVLLHDFPEFLCEHHHELCDVIPTSCIQMRNLILSAFPRNMRLPDPFTPNLKVDMLIEVSQPPRQQLDKERLLPEGLKALVDQYVRNRTPATLPQDLVKRLMLPISEAKISGGSYSVAGINALVMYIGCTAKPGSSPMDKSAAGPTPGNAMELYLRVAAELDSEGRNLLFNAVANQLRYPNSHTFYFSCVLLGLFSDMKSEQVKEQVTRVLLERLIVNRPHPWGLLITFIELIKNPRYNFWSHEFTRCSPDIERLFKNVASSCTGPVKPDQGAAAGQGAEEGHMAALAVAMNGGAVGSKA